MSKAIIGKIRGLSQYYADGLERMEIWIDKKFANSLPCKANRHVPIVLVFGKESYTGNIMCTSKNPYIWVSPKLANYLGKRTNLAAVLQSQGYSKNDSIVLEAKQNIIRLTPYECTSHATESSSLPPRVDALDVKKAYNPPIENSADQSEVEKVRMHCERNLDLSISLENEYSYRSLPSCVIDAVYSIGVKYESTSRTVKRYCDYFDLKEYHPRSQGFPPVELQQSLEELIRNMDQLGIERFTHEVFVNRRRTSSRNGIPKAEAVYRFSQVLREHGVNYLQDVEKVITSQGLDADIRTIPGQRSGISLGYFFMLAGSDDMIKPDRMILRFLCDALGRPVQVREAQTTLREVARRLESDYPNITPRLLDYAIWVYQRKKD